MLALLQAYVSQVRRLYKREFQDFIEVLKTNHLNIPKEDAEWGLQIASLTAGTRNNYKLVMNNMVPTDVIPNTIMYSHKERKRSKSSTKSTGSFKLNSDEKLSSGDAMRSIFALLLPLIKRETNFIIDFFHLGSEISMYQWIKESRGLKRSHDEYKSGIPFSDSGSQKRTEYN